MNISALICGQLVACILLTLFECGECSSNRTDIELRNNKSTILTEITAKNCTAAGFPHQSSCTSKSRRKRYVAFPEGSSFSVSVFANTFNGYHSVTPGIAASFCRLRFVPLWVLSETRASSTSVGPSIGDWHMICRTRRGL